jgi:hypothetical protein
MKGSGRQRDKCGEDAWLSRRRLGQDGLDKALGRAPGAESVGRTRIGVSRPRMGGEICKCRAQRGEQRWQLGADSTQEGGVVC